MKLALSFSTRAIVAIIIKFEVNFPEGDVSRSLQNWFQNFQADFSPEAVLFGMPTQLNSLPVHLKLFVGVLRLDSELPDADQIDS